MVPVDDHGLEVLKKSGEEVTSGNKSDYYIKTSNVNGTFSPPVGADYILRTNSPSNVETFVYKKGGASGTVLKTITVTYSDSTLSDLVSVAVS